VISATITKSLVNKISKLSAYVSWLTESVVCIQSMSAVWKHLGEDWGWWHSREWWCIWTPVYGVCQAWMTVAEKHTLEKGWKLICCLAHMQTFHTCDFNSYYY